MNVTTGRQIVLAAAEKTTTTYAAGFTAPLIVDPYNDFMSADGVELGYHVALIKDATAAFDWQSMHATHEVNGPRFAQAILTTEELVALLTASARQEQSLSTQRRRA